MRSISEHKNNKNSLDLQDITCQSLWYSKCCLLSVSLMSGFGLPWNYDITKVNEWLSILQENDAQYNLPENITLLRAVYKKGDSFHCKEYNGNMNDYSNFLWDDSTFKKDITPSSQAYLIIDEVMLSKYLCNHECTTSGPPDRLLALILINSAILQAEFMSNYLRNSDGLLITKSDKSKDPCIKLELKEDDEVPEVADQALALKAFSILSRALNDSSYPMFMNEKSFQMFSSHADQIYSMLEDSAGEVFNSKTKDLSCVISSCIEYYKLCPTNKVLNYITMLSLELESRIDMSGNLIRYPDENDLTSSTSCFLALKSLIESYRLTEICKFSSAASILYKKLDLLWDQSSSLYSLDSDDKYRYTLRDVGSVIAGLNSMRLFGEEQYRSDAENKLVLFFNSAINKSGLLQSCIPLPKDIRMDADDKQDETEARKTWHIDVPAFPESGIAPVFAKKFTYKPKKHKSSVNSKSFYSDYALFIVNEMFCMNYPDFECFYSKDECTIEECKAE